MSEFNTTKLEEEEIKDPYLVILRFFDYADLASIREYLWNWLKISVSGTFNTKMITKHERYDMIYFFEHIEKLVEAVHLIKLRELEDEKSKKEKKKK
jgi:hypothetical protein